MKRFGRWLLVSLAYLVYTLGVVVVLLWILFPADGVLVWLQGKLQNAYPGLAWNINRVEKEFPLGITFADVGVYEKNDQENPLILFNEMRISPAVEGMLKLKKQVPVAYRLKTPEGTIEGELSLPGKGLPAQCSGEIRNIELGMFEEIWKKINRTASGSMSGTFQYSGFWQDPLHGELQASVEVRDGEIGLQQGIFGLEQIDFHLMSASVNLKDRIFSLDSGMMESRLFTANYEGSLQFADNLYTSALNIQGLMEPRSELLGGMNNTAASLIRSQLQNNKLSFVINGTLFEPGIIFRGASGIIDGIIESGGR
ncbi:MAG: type II secretion system protein GspN [Desulfobulbaceae bacterium]|nr:type II secretion system protein GspN [Desulfobulbaceae bacterium]